MKLKRLTLLAGVLGVTYCAAAGQTRPQAIQHPQVGVCTHLDWWKNDKIPGMIAEAGFTWIRDDFSWALMEQEKGKYELPPAYIKMLDDANAANLKVIAILNGGNDIYKPDIYDPEAYARAAAWFAKATAGKVHVIEILNEPANFGYTKHYGGSWNGVDRQGNVDAWVEKYVTLLNAAAKAVKAANPQMQVIGLGSVPPVNFRQIAMGIAPEVDGVTEHPYSFRLLPEYVPYAADGGILRRDGIATADEQGTFASQVKMYDALLEKHHGPKTVWLTEWGWPTFSEDKPGNQYSGVTESAQAKYILRRLTESLGLGITVTVIYDFFDDGDSPYENEHNMGLVRRDLTPKPSYHAVQRFNRHMVGFTPRDIVEEVNVFPVYARSDRQPIIWDGTRIQSQGQAMVYQFADAKGTARIAFWSVERADGDLNPSLGDIEIQSKTVVKKIELFDFMTGQVSPVEFEARGDRYVIKKIRIRDYPVTLTLY